MCVERTFKTICQISVIQYNILYHNSMQILLNTLKPNELQLIYKYFVIYVYYPL